MKYILFLSFLFFAASASAQSWDKPTVEKLLCKEWNVDRIVMDGQEQPPEDGEENNTMTFQADHKALASGEEEPAEWTYDEEKHGIDMKLPGEEETAFMKIVEISADKLVLEMAEEGSSVQIYMSSGKK